MEDLEKQDHNKEVIREILEYVLNDYYILDIILNYNTLIFVTDGKIKKHVLYINILEYKVELDDSLDVEDLDKIKNVCLVGVHNELIDKELTKKVLYELSGCIQAIESNRHLLDINGYLKARDLIRNLPYYILKDVIKQEEKREKA